MSGCGNKIHRTAVQHPPCASEASRMTQRHSPTVRRRRLAKVLRELREASGMSGAQVEKDLGFSKGKLSRTEAGDWKLPNLRDVRLLLDHYGFTDPAKQEVLIDWARHGRKRDWWESDEQTLDDKYGLYIGMEAEAKRIYTFQNSLVPGLLQTEDTARAIFADPIKPLTPAEIDKRVEIRMSRQEVLTGENPLELVVVLDEALLHKKFGGPAAHARQVAHLADMAELPNVTIYFLPLEAEETAARHGFAIIEFPHEQDWDAVFLETLAGHLVLEDPEPVRTYHTAFRKLVGSALNPKDSVARLTGMSG